MKTGADKLALGHRTAAPFAPLLEALRGLRMRHLAVALAVGASLTVLNGFFLAVTYSRGHVFLPKLPGLLLPGITLTLAVVIADAYVRHGARPIAAYSAALLVAATVTPVLKWYLTRALGGENFFDADVPLAIQRTEMLFYAILLLVQSGLGTAAYVQWRERENVQRRLRASELRRAQAERHIQQARLRAMQARVEPDFLFAALQRVGELAATASTRADRLLGSLIELLRRLTPGGEIDVERTTSSVEHELSLAVAYLRVHDECAGATRELEVSISAEAASAQLPPMLVLPLVRAIVRGEGAQRARLRIQAAVTGGLLMLSFSRDGGAEALIDDVARAKLRHRLEENFDAGAARADTSGPPGTLTLHLPLIHEPEQADRPHR